MARKALSLPQGTAATEFNKKVWALSISPFFMLVLETWFGPHNSNTEHKDEGEYDLIKSKYRICKIIGHGTDGTVCLCKLRTNWLAKFQKFNNGSHHNSSNNGSSSSNNGTDVRAMKIIDKSKVPKPHLKDIYNEMAILKQVSSVFCPFLSLFSCVRFAFFPHRSVCVWNLLLFCI